MKRVTIAVIAGVLSVSAALAAAPPATTPPAPGAPPATTPSGNPPVRYDWKGNHTKAQAALKAKDYKTAIILFTEILNSGRLPKTWLAPTLYMRGKAYRETRQYQLAIADYQAAIAADPNMDVAHYEMGATYQLLGQHAKAVEAFGKAIKIKGNNADYFLGRCISHTYLNNYRAAIPDCETASRMRPRDADLLATLGRLYEETGQKQRAIETYKLALSINPNQADARDGLKALTR